jgi:hypothetical protein
MPVHDWTRVSAGTFHAFHTAWTTHLMESLNGGVLPKGYYALAEQHVGRVFTDVLTLHASEEDPANLGGFSTESGGVAVVDAPPRVRRRLVAAPNTEYRTLRRSVAIRHVSGHRLVALIEIASPANKDRAKSVEEFAEKVVAALRAGCHVVLVDLFPPGKLDAKGLHGAIWEYYDVDEPAPPADQPLVLASYVSWQPAEAYVEYLAVGEPLPEMPLFLEINRYVPLPLEPTYEAAYRGMPAYWREVIEGRREEWEKGSGTLASL